VGADLTPALYAFLFERPEPGVARDPFAPTGLASGDSGSPSFVRTSKGAELLGVNTFTLRRSGSDSPPFGFGTVGGGQVLAGHLSWILDETGADSASQRR
jgi:hypothetical protein